MVRKCFCCVFLLLHFCSGSFGQNRRIDSLYRAESSATDPRIKIRLQHQIVSATWDFDLEKAFEVAKREAELARQLNDPQGRMIALTDMGMYHYFAGNYDEANRLYRQAL